MLCQPRPFRPPPPSVLEFAPKIALGPCSYANALARKRSIAQCQPGPDVVMLEIAEGDSVNRRVLRRSFEMLRHLQNCHDTCIFQYPPCGNNPTMNIDRLKQEICEIGRRIYTKGFAAGNAGNISYRLSSNEVLCTPTLISKGFM